MPAYDDANVSGEVLDSSGRPLPSVQAYWFAWYAFHPQTTIYQATSKKGAKP